MFPLFILPSSLITTLIIVSPPLPVAINLTYEISENLLLLSPESRHYKHVTFLNTKNDIPVQHSKYLHKTETSQLIIHAQTNKMHTYKICFVCVILSAPTYFDHSCDHLQGVPQYKYKEYNRSHMKFMIKFCKILSFINAA